jgi:2-octaprenyl-6-methoxyphenol hydroxylase
MPLHKIVVVGSGAIAMTTAILLDNLPNVEVVLIANEKNKLPKKMKPERCFAISKGSISVLKKSGIWDQLSPLAFGFTAMRISGKSNPDQLHFLNINAQDIGETHLGCILREGILIDALFEQLKNLNVKRKDMAYLDKHNNNIKPLLAEYDLCIIADGRAEELINWVSPKQSIKDYNETALVCDVYTSTPLKPVAIQDFTSYGPLALLPSSQYSYSLIWSLENQQFSDLINWSDDDLIKFLNDTFRGDIPPIKELSKRSSFPLFRYHAGQYFRENFVLIGDAVHRIHPLAGQGLNLGFSDLVALYDSLLTTTHRHWMLAETKMLKRYERERRKENTKIIIFTDLVDRLFRRNRPLASHLLSLADNNTIKKMMTDQAFGSKNKVN